MPDAARAGGTGGCSARHDATANRTSFIAAGGRQIGRIADGIWTMRVDFTLQCALVIEVPLTIAEGKLKAELKHPRDPVTFDISGAVAADGVVTLRGIGSIVRLEGRGKIDKDKGSGDMFIIHGDGDCSAKWTVARNPT